MMVGISQAASFPRVLNSAASQAGYTAETERKQHLNASMWPSG